MCDNERDALERALVKEVSELPLDLQDPADQYWFIETELLRIRELEATVCREQNETQRVSAEAQIIEAKARLAEAQNEAAKIEAANPRTDAALDFSVILEADCSYCGSKFSYRGNDEDMADTSYSRFCETHDPCGRR